MKKIHELPDWFSRDVTKLEMWLPSTEIVFEREDNFFFDGMAGAFLKAGKIPHAIEIALDATEMSCLAKLSFGDCSDEQSVFVPFEIESFALLWNADPKKVHGMNGDKITLALLEGDLRYPFVSSAGVICNLFLRDGRFRAEPDVENAGDLLEIAA